MTIERVLSGEATHHVACSRAESFIDSLPDGCVSLMTLDFPYYGVKDDAWDNAWATPEAFIEWMGGVLAKCRRVLAPNGSIYVFASPRMAWGVEGKVRERFAVLTNIRWNKATPGLPRVSGRTCPAALRAYFPDSETVIFAEPPGTAPYEETVAYLRAERDVAALTNDMIDDLCGWRTKAFHFFANHADNFCFPTQDNYAAMRAAVPGRFLRDYDSLRAEYENRCRTFTVAAAVPYTDVWTYPTVQAYPGKHPCEKPEDMARDMVRASSRPGGLVADFFCGSGAFLAAAVAEGRRAIGCDMDPHWAEQAQRRCDTAKATGRVVRTGLTPKSAGQTELFDLSLRGQLGRTP